MSKAIEDVLAERRRQIEVEDFSSTYDDMATRGQLASAGACYALTASGTPIAVIETLWPWAAKWWKPTTVRRNLIKAAALLLAEIERIDRATARNATGG